jgi:hypothetical protein
MRKINISVDECNSYWSVHLHYEYSTELTCPNHSYSAAVKTTGLTALDAIINLCKTLKKQKKQMSPKLAAALFSPLENKEI